MKASQNNDLVHQTGLTLEETVARYTAWAKDYETDLCENNFRGPSIVANQMNELFPDTSSRAGLRVIDVAAGTGFVGLKLNSLGFEHIDALEPSEGMLKCLKEKNVYKNAFPEYLNGETLSVQTDTYDVAVISGGMGEGHIPCKGLEELPRIVKPGGYVLIAMREEYLDTCTEYKDRLEPHMAKLEEMGLWQRLTRNIIPKYSFDNNGVLYTFTVK